MHRIGRNTFQKTVPLRVYPWPRTKDNSTPQPRKNGPSSAKQSNARKRDEIAPSLNTRTAKTYFLPPFL